MRRRVLAGVGAWLGALGVAVAVAHPESCPRRPRRPRPTVGRRRGTWIAVNQADDGAFLYRYDRDDGVVVPGYSTVRHAGTLLALEQARGAGIDGADDVAARGLGVGRGAADPARRWRARR